MGLLSYLRGDDLRSSSTEGETRSLPAPENESRLAGLPTIWSGSTFWKLTPVEALAIADVWAAVRVLSDAVSSLPLHAFRKTEQGRERVTSISGYYHSLFEALDWANTLDNRLRRDWKPDWHTEVEDGESLPGIRWARNAVRHQWDEAVYLDTNGEGMNPRALNVHWRWMPELTGDKRDPQGRDAYAEHLADQVVLTTLTKLMPVFASVGVERGEFGTYPVVVRPIGYP